MSWAASQRPLIVVCGASLLLAFVGGGDAQGATRPTTARARPRVSTPTTSSIRTQRCKMQNDSSQRVGLANPDPVSPALVRAATHVVWAKATIQGEVVKLQVLRRLKASGIADNVEIDAACDRFGSPPDVGVFLLDGSSPPNLMSSSLNGVLTPIRVQAALRGGTLSFDDPSDAELLAAAQSPKLCVIQAKIEPTADGLSAKVQNVEKRLAGERCPVVGDVVSVHAGAKWDFGRNAQIAGLVIAETGAGWIAELPTFSPSPSLYRRLRWV